MLKLILLLYIGLQSRAATPVTISPPMPSPAPVATPTGGDAPTAAAKATPQIAHGVVPSIITKAVGEVDDRIVTSREVQFSQAIDQAIAAKPVEAAAPTKHKVLTGQEMQFVAEVSKVLDEWVVFLEAKTLSSSPVSKADYAQALKAVDDMWAQNADWKALEVSPTELKDAIERKLLVRDFERLKSDPQLAPVSDDDALAYYRKNRLRFGSLPFSSFKDNIKAFLVKAQTERRLNEWREILRRKYKVRNLIAG